MGFVRKEQRGSRVEDAICRLWPGGTRATSMDEEEETYGEVDCDNG